MIALVPLARSLTRLSRGVMSAYQTLLFKLSALEADPFLLSSLGLKVTHIFSPSWVRTRAGAMEAPRVKVFLFFLIALLSLNVKVEGKMLDLAPDAVDDDFSDCRDKMLEVVTDNLLQKELTAEEQFNKIWSQHSKRCTKKIPGGTSLHTDALQAYGNAKVDFRKKFNNLVYSKGNNMTYRDEFNFKSLHFLLTDSLRLLKPKNCTTVYYGTNIMSDLPPDGSSAPPLSFRILLAVMSYILSNLLLMSLL
ncbi:hypothetical protein QTP70_028184 [Hemibagrus guttatus]|uniref:NAD(P)(+)--arginine ADP-ribosyltransferase n=1 Tax=Hemibagrus guttatus TaxID=175788 RepID=A0AAE0PT70_9TELE|nr:hypothetical protein QTP70_028184 [Hemibagrus guttatus]